MLHITSPSLSLSIYIYLNMYIIYTYIYIYREIYYYCIYIYICICIHVISDVHSSAPARRPSCGSASRRAFDCKDSSFDCRATSFHCQDVSFDCFDFSGALELFTWMFIMSLLSFDLEACFVESAGEVFTDGIGTPDPNPKHLVSLCF